MRASEMYPWYKLVTEDDLLNDEKNVDPTRIISQGDILMGCPVVQLATPAQWPLPTDISQVEVKIEYVDIIVMTQACDLANNKVQDVTVCRHISVIAERIGRKEQEEVIKGRRDRYAMLEQASFESFKMDRRMIDLGAIYSVPVELLRMIANEQVPRVRLLPPYREHISQAFARFFMRVGLPQNIKFN